MTLREALEQLRTAAIKAGAHIVVTNDYPDGVAAFKRLCDAVDVADAVLAAEPPAWPSADDKGAVDAFTDELMQCGLGLPWWAARGMVVSILAALHADEAER